MLQLAALQGRLLREYALKADFPPKWTSMRELEAHADRYIAKLRDDRVKIAAGNPLLVLRTWADRHLRTDRIEHFDRDNVDPADKVALARELHFVNRVVRAYPSFLGALRPHLERVAKREGRPARLLELASGSGEFTLALALAAREQGLPVAVTGSDYNARYVDEANARAQERGLDVSFRVVNAFDMSGLDTAAYDVVFIAQSIHHFSPGQIAMMIAQSRRVGPEAFVGIDGYRSVSVLVLSMFVGLGALRLGLRRAYMMWHDAWVSTRKFLPAAELELIARIAAPNDDVRLSRQLPYHSVLEVTPR